MRAATSRRSIDLRQAYHPVPQRSKEGLCPSCRIAYPWPTPRALERRRRWRTATIRSGRAHVHLPSRVDFRHLTAGGRRRLGHALGRLYDALACKLQLRSCATKDGIEVAWRSVGTPLR